MFTFATVSISPPLAIFLLILVTILPIVLGFTVRSHEVRNGLICCIVISFFVAIVLDANHVFGYTRERNWFLSPGAYTAQFNSFIAAAIFFGGAYLLRKLSRWHHKEEKDKTIDLAKENKENAEEKNKEKKL